MSTPLRRVGHKGADLLVPGNTLESFDAALEAGVDMIEFDVLPARTGDALLLAHDHEDAEGRTPHTLEEALAHFGTPAYEGVELDVDLKLPGYELRVIAALHEHGLLERTLISSQYRESLVLLRQEEPQLRLGWSVPKISQDPFRSRAMAIPAQVGLVAYRAALPVRAARAITSGVCNALMVQWRLVTPRLVRAVTRAGGEVYVWTVDDLPRMRALRELGVTGLITNDPRLFAALPA